jgi:hypothetical protein
MSSMRLSVNQNTTALNLPSRSNARSTVLVWLSSGGFWKSKCQASTGGAKGTKASVASSTAEVCVGANL